MPQEGRETHGRHANQELLRTVVMSSATRSFTASGNTEEYTREAARQLTRIETFTKRPERKLKCTSESPVVDQEGSTL